MRLIEGAAGVCAAIGLIMLLQVEEPLTQVVMAIHYWMFLYVLIVFSVGTFLLYPMLFKFGLVPKVLAAWGLIGGGMLLLSCISLLFGWIEMGGTTDLVLSLPIWINEMALAIWLIIRGFDLSQFVNERNEA
jgi:membrane protease YdiL (CAAX protease family)